MTRLLPGDAPPPRGGLFTSVSFPDVLALLIFAAALAGLVFAPPDLRDLFLFLAGYGLGRMRFGRSAR